MAVAAYAGQDVLKIHLKDGSTQTIAVSAIDSLTFEQMQSAGTFSVVDLTTKSVELKFVPAKTLGAFNIGVRPQRLRQRRSILRRPSQEI